MITSESTDSLIQVICLLTAVATLSWIVMAVPMRIAPKASKRFALANFCMFIGMLLYSQRSGETSYLYWFSADLIILFGFSVLRRGAQTLYYLPTSIKFDSGLIILTAVLMLLVPPQKESAAYLVTVLSFAAAISFFGLARDHYRAFKNTFTSFATYWLVVPVVIIGLLFLLRAIGLIIYPEHVAMLATIDKVEAKPVLWTYILLILLVNILIVGNAINKLVTKIITIANKDPLTGCWNRYALKNKMANLHLNWLEQKQCYSLILLDLDYFKSINDNFGHIFGDEVLKIAATTIQSQLKKDDLFFRYGGEEFLILVPNCNQQQVLALAEQCKASLNQLQIQHKGHQLMISASFGCGTIQSEQSDEELLFSADQAMYQAKDAGRNCIKQV